MSRNILFQVTVLFVLAGVSLADQQEHIKGQSADNTGRRDRCGILAQIKTYPFFGREPITDPIVYDIWHNQREWIPILIECITNDMIIKDPRSSPARIDTFRIGDLSFFLLNNIIEVGDKVLPTSVLEGYKEMGVYAYFRWVENPANRKALQNSCAAWWKENGSSWRKSPAKPTPILPPGQKPN